MRLTHLCIERPVFATVLSLVLIILGVMSYTRLPIQFAPTVFEPHLNIQVNYPGASAELMEETVVQPLENSLAQTPNLTMMHSSSFSESSSIHLVFKSLSKEDFLMAQSQVMQEIGEVDLPTGVSQPKIYSGGETWPEMFVSVSDYKKDNIALADYVQNNFVKPLQHIPGVALVSVNAETPALRLTLHPLEMARLGVTVAQLKQVMQENNLSVPLGYLVSQDQEIPLNATLTLPTVTAFQNLIIGKTQSGSLIRLNQVADIAVGPVSLGGNQSTINGQPGITLAISFTDDANPIIVGGLVKKTLHAMAVDLPPGMKLGVLFSTADVLKQSVLEVMRTIFYAVILVSLVSLIFLGRPKIALIPIVTIPVCLIGSFTLIWACGFSINIMTLLALVLATGLVVDDAIVVLENCHRHVESGLEPKAATHQSLREISFAVLGMTVCLLAVYIPTAFIPGKTAIYFREFALTLGGAVLISGFVALTLTPMMCAKILKNNLKIKNSQKYSKQGYEHWVDLIFNQLKNQYQLFLNFILKIKYFVLAAFVLLILSSVFVFNKIPSALMPPFNMGFIYMGTVGPLSSSVLYTERESQKILEQVQKIPGVNLVGFWSGGMGKSSNQGNALITLKSGNNTGQVLSSIQKIGQSSSSLSVFATEIDPFGQDQSSSEALGDISFSLNGVLSYPELAQAADLLKAELIKNPMIQSVNNGLQLNQLQYDVSINRVLAADLGVSISNITDTLGAFIGGAELGVNYISNNNSYPIIMQMPENKLADFSMLNNLFVQTSSGELLPLSEFVSFKEVTGLSARFHINQMRAAPMGVSLKPGVPAGLGMNFIQETANKILPSGVDLTFSGQSQKLLESNNSMTWIFILGLVFIYLILAALFESFLDPLIILLTVPLCVIGAVFILLFLPSGSLNVFTGVGLVTLIGLVAKHGILITNFANQLRAEGQDLISAITQAAGIRLRPILMTTFTMILGAVPLLFSEGPGMNARVQIAVVIIAGLLIGTIFSLLIVPVAYVLLDGLKIKNKI